MNAVELMEGKFLLLQQRVQKLEVLFASRAVLSGDEREAERIAGTLGFAIDIIMLSHQTGERRKLAIELKQLGWPVSRIARVLKCCERTVERWLGAK